MINIPIIDVNMYLNKTKSFPPAPGTKTPVFTGVLALLHPFLDPFYLYNLGINLYNHSTLGNYQNLLKFKF